MHKTKEVPLKPTRNKIWNGAKVLEKFLPGISVAGRASIAESVYKAMVGRLPYIGSDPANVPEVSLLRVYYTGGADLDDIGNRPELNFKRAKFESDADYRYRLICRLIDN